MKERNENMSGIAIMAVVVLTVIIMVIIAVI
jgi:hypothetical protein